MVNTLLIIGNGFDLYCDLRTSYSDYYAYKTKKWPLLRNFDSLYLQLNTEFNKFESAFISFINDYGIDIFTHISIWDLFFVCKNGNKAQPDWYNIEEQIANSLLKLREGIPFWNKVYGYINYQSLNINQDAHNALQDGAGLEKLISMTIKYVHCEKISYGDRIKYDENVHFRLRHIEQNWNDFLLEQLKLLEKDFKEYVIDTQNNNQFYKLSQKNLFERLIIKGNANLLSFNYTSVYPTSIFQTVENVHGKVAGKGEIIFGIDNTNCKPGDMSYVFTKTYRKVAMYTTYPEKEVNDILVDKINRIIIFGHSLNEQDYSYFQSIFDHYDLYNSNIKLNFRYHVYDQQMETAIKRIHINRIVSLLDKYASSIENRSKGGNLIHKLLVEGRLIIKLV
jgi:hypothetical protein